MVPEGWKLRTIKDVGSVITGSTPKTADQTLYDGPVPFVSPADLGTGRPITSTIKTLTEKGFAATRRIRKGSTLFTCIGSTIGKIGLAGVDLATNQQINSVVPNSSHDDAFIYYALALRARHIAMLAGKQAVPIINKSMFSDQPILTPPLPEQKKIAQILSTWDQAITATERLLENSQQRKKGLMQQLLTGKKRLVDMSTVPSHGDLKPSKSPYRHLPSDWAEVTLSKVSSFITKGATPTTYGFEWQVSGIPFIRSECVGENGFRASGLAHICRDAHEAMGRSKVFNGDILITITGNVGRVCMLPERFEEANINQHIAKITLDEATVDRDFVFQCLQDRKYRVQFERITTGQAYPQISLVQVRDTIIPMPPLHEQRKIALLLSTADHEISALKLRLSVLRQEKHALMQQLLTGKRRVNVETEAA